MFVFDLDEIKVASDPSPSDAYEWNIKQGAIRLPSVSFFFFYFETKIILF